MEVEGAPSPEVIRSLILSLKISEPIVFRKIHKNWNPVNWDLEKFSTIMSEDGPLRCRVGKISIDGQEPQWESETGVKLLSWNSMGSWRSNEEWVYFDYKNMKDVVCNKYFHEFEWSRLGFPERDGEVCNLWVGSAGCCTPCHFDTYGSNLVCQVKGRKRWLMFSPAETRYMHPSRIPYEESSVYSKINFARPSSSVIQELKKIDGVSVVLEAGDVLFVPPKWWHFVQSQDFSISVNTWIEMPSDYEMRVDEAIMRSITSAFVSVSSPETAVCLLNPNEEELLDVSEVEIEKFLKSAANDLFKQESQSHNPPMGDLHPAPKKAKLDSVQNLLLSPTLSDMLRECTSVAKMESFDPLKFYNSDLAISHDIPEEPSPKKPTSHMAHLINALGHPDIIKTIREKFLENLRSSNQT